ncbi:MAG: cobalamin-binding protein, partial [Myxococcales bacterium]|nr:cobalamin-binding protein [Myxococcales bacterium]
SEILQSVRLIASLVGESSAGESLAAELHTNLVATTTRSRALTTAPRVYFEEWHDPMISGIRWVSELVEVAGGIDVFSRHRCAQAAKDRIVTPQEVLDAGPDIYIASWCGKMAKRRKIDARLAGMAALETDDLYEIRSEYILQPGPAALTDGLRQLELIVQGWGSGQRSEERTAGGLRSVLGQSSPWGDS